jgi:hypothetical protein
MPNSGQYLAVHDHIQIFKRLIGNIALRTLMPGTGAFMVTMYLLSIYIERHGVGFHAELSRFFHREVSHL